MGVVYKGRDTRLDRYVALKILPPDKAADEDRRRRFVQEAKAVSALNHPGIVALYDIDDAEGIFFIAMEYIAGKTLEAIIPEGGLPVRDVIRYAEQISGALAAAHSAGIVHRDLKPGNIMITEAGRVKLLDFGLAKLDQDSAAEGDATRSLDPLTKVGSFVGTAAYMSPEQAESRPVSARSDVFSFGAVLYEMLAGRQAFSGRTLAALAYAVVHKEPAQLAALRPDAPRELVHVIERALAKDPRKRYASAFEMHREIAALAEAAPPRRPIRSRLAAAVLLAAAVPSLSWWVWNQSKVRWAHEKALPEVVRLTDQGSYLAAYDLARRAQRWIGGDPILSKEWLEFTQPISFETDPPGARVRYQEYAATANEWRELGRTPVRNARIPRAVFRWRIELPDYVTADLAGRTPPPRLHLYRPGEGPTDMVYVMPGRFAPPLGLLGALPARDMPGFWMDKFEVTNRQFKSFVDAGGYQKPAFWNQRFTKDGKVVSWEQAMALFRDSTGRPGPATWEAGTYAEGKDDFPVSGVSWYEAEAYAQFAGKQLPTYYHWHRAAVTPLAASIVPLSNFSKTGPARVGERSAMSPWGTFDMAGNVREWTATENQGTRYILGGGWSDMTYAFPWAVWLSPWDRAPENGFRCVKYDGALPQDLAAPLLPSIRDPNAQKPVSDEAFRVFRSLYAREPAQLDSRIEASDESPQYWVRQKVSYNTGSAEERMAAVLLIPKQMRRPLEAIIYVPGSGSLTARSLDQAVDNLAPQLDFLMKSGRAMIFPTLWGTFERQAGLQELQHNRQAVMQWVHDIGATIDYLQSRSELDAGRIGYLGFSMGSRLGTILVALEPRTRVAVFLDGGIPFMPRSPEADELNFAPRVRVPVLMVNGRFDQIWPALLSQAPLYRLLGPPAKDKKYVLLDTSHGVLARKGEVAREVMDWLDHYLGPAGS
jgi:dienelactone hydrolase/predicted Ser/Thr protein kinase